MACEPKMSRITNLRAFVPKLTQMGKTETVTGMVDGSKVTASFHDGKLKSIFTDGNTAPVDRAVIDEIADFYALTSRASFHLYVAPTPTRLMPAQIRAEMMND